MAKKGAYETQIVISGKLDNSFEGTIGKAKRELQGLYYQQKRQGSTVGGIEQLGSFSDKTFAMVAQASKTAALGGTAILSASTAVGMGYEKQMSVVQSISNATAGEMRKLDEVAQEMGRTTQFSAAEAGKGLEYMAMAGWKADQMTAGLPAILSLAAASGEDLGAVSDIVTDALTAFGLTAEDAAVFSDVLAQASSNSNTNVGMMGETFKYVAPVAGALKFSIQDTAVAIGLMANAGIKGSQSGTALRSIMSRLTKPTSEVQGAMEKLGLSITDSDGNMKSFREIMVDIRSGFDGLSTAEQASVAASLAGQEAMSGLLAIANAAPEDFEKLTESIENSAGAAERMAETRIDNLAGDFTLLQSAAEGAGIGIYQTFNGILREGVQGASQLLNDFTESDFLGNLVERMPTNRRIGKEIGEFVKSALEPLIAVGNWFWQHPDILAGSISGIGSALLTFKAAEGATSLIRTVGSLAGMIGAWPVAAAGVAVGGIVGISTAIKKANRDAAGANLARHFGKISLSMEELDETAKAIVANKNMEKASQAIEELGKIKELSEDFFEADKNLDRLNWKIGMGFELSEGDQQEYADAIDSMVRGSIDIVEQAQYTATISVQALFGESQVGNSLITGFNEVYEELNAELAALGKELGDVYSAALEDGVIDIDEAETIQEIQKKMSEITQKVAQAEFDAKLKRLGEGASGGDLDAETFKNTQAQVKEELAAQEAELGQATDYALAASGLRYSEGKISKEEYDKEQAEIMQQYQT
ncbi:MAG: phage tail tape measure protein, partial [Lachnospiraceae bacterium]|nr:phage tail tape measure protein [Lachnospiraceae bacterium]